MNSKFSNQDLVDATLEIYNRFDEKITTPTSQKPDSKIPRHEGYHDEEADENF